MNKKNEIEETKLSMGIQTDLNNCKEVFTKLLHGIFEGKNQKAHKMEQHIFSGLMLLGLHLLKLFINFHNKGDYGETIQTEQGIAERGRTSERSYFSIFGKLKIKRYLYEINGNSFAPLDIILNLPKRCYSYYLSEICNLLTIGDAYNHAASLFKRVFGLIISTSALETICDESSECYTEYYDLKITLPKPAEIEEIDYKVVSFDGKGVPMIKKEAAKIESRPGKGEKKQKKKEALVGVKYEVNANVRTAEEVAGNLVYPDKNKEECNSDNKKTKAQNIRYIASIEKPKREVMEEIHAEVIHEDLKDKPLVCVMDGALYLWEILKEVFQDIENKVLILDIIHVVEYLWIAAHVKYKEGSADCKKYVYENLLLILQGNVSLYIWELQNDIMNTKKWNKTQREKLQKVLTYLENHQQYMKYDEYLKNGYPIGTGVVESACGHLVKCRMEITGARWGINGAESVLKMRSIYKSNDWNEYWEFIITQSNKNEFFADDYLDAKDMGLCA